jgi:Recombinase
VRRMARAKKANAGADAVRAKADAHAAMVIPIIEAIRGEGITGLTSIARELTRRRIPTSRDGKWDASRVRVLLARAAE